MNTLPISPAHIPAARQLLQEVTCPLPACPQGLVVEKEGEVVGVCLLGSSRVEMLTIAPLWRRRGYGSFLLRKALHALGAFAGQEVTAAPPADEAGRALLAKFGFVPRGGEMVRPVRRQLTALELGHRLLAAHLRPGDFAVDATAGRGRDTLFLSRLVGESGKVLAMDIQPDAVRDTRALLERHGVRWAEVHIADHARLAEFASPASADAVVFNFGWLPGGDHALFTTPATSIPALEAGLEILRPGGILLASIYHGGANGTAERDVLAPWLAGLDEQKYTVVRCDFANRGGKDPLVFLVHRC